MRILPLLLCLIFPAYAAASTVTFPGGSSATVEVAANDVEREAVMEERSAIDPDGGILFQYPQDKATRTVSKPGFELDVVYLSAAGKVLKLQPGLAADGRSSGRGTYVLSLPKGSISRRGLKVGDVVKIGAPAVPAAAANAPAQAAVSDDKTATDMLNSIRAMKGTMPNDMYQKLEAMGLQMSQRMQADPGADPMALLQELTGIDVGRINQLSAQARQQNPGMTEEQIARQVAAQMVADPSLSGIQQSGSGAP